MKKKALLSSILVIALCLSVIAGSTLALFTTYDDMNIAVTAGRVELTADIIGESMQTWSDPMKYYSHFGFESDYTVRNAIADGDEFYSPFDNGGEARITNIGEGGAAAVVVTNMTPGDVVKFTVDVKNNSNVNIQYRVRMYHESPENPGVPDLTDVLVTTAYIDGALYEMSKGKGQEKITPWRFIDKMDAADATKGQIEDFDITIEFPDDGISLDANGNLNHNNRDNKYQNGYAEMYFIVEAVQANGVPFEATTNLANLTDGSLDNVISDGAYNGEGQTYDVPEYLVADEFVSFANMTLKNDEDSVLYATSDYSDGTTIVLAEKATLEVADYTNAITIARGDRFATDTVVIDETAKVKFGAVGGVLMAQYSEAGVELNVVLNGTKADGCFVADAEDLKCAFAFAGADNAKVTVNMLVKDAESVTYYKNMIDPASYGVTINWYVDGVIYDTTVLANR